MCASYCCCVLVFEASVWQYFAALSCGCWVLNSVQRTSGLELCGALFGKWEQVDYRIPRTYSGTQSCRQQKKWRHFRRAQTAFLGRSTAYAHEHASRVRERKTRPRIHPDRTGCKDCWPVSTLASTRGKIMQYLSDWISFKINFCVIFMTLWHRPIAK
jgi:hypothetical protein